jgi:hypothetical protein
MLRKIFFLIRKRLWYFIEYLINFYLDDETMNILARKSPLQATSSADPFSEHMFLVSKD